MDIVTHGMMGAVVASPFLAAHPAEATGFILGSVFPDLDSFSRVFGKHAFLKWHQTFTHSLVWIGVLGSASWLALIWLRNPYASAAAFVMLGMAAHALLDATNTYGAQLWTPISRERVRREWFFFIDIPVFCFTALTVIFAASYLWKIQSPPLWLAVGYVAICLAYGEARVGLRGRALRIAPADTIALLPTALSPWRFLGFRKIGDTVETFAVHVLRNQLELQVSYHVFDEQYEDTLRQVPEYRVMRELSSGYNVVSAIALENGTRLLCQDLRTRNFHTRFGELEIELDLDNQPRHANLYV